MLATICDNEPRDLTPTQAKRLAKRIQGQSFAAIAENEGVTKQAVAKTLEAPKVKDAVFTLLGRPLTSKNAETGESIDIVCLAMQVVTHVMESATRPVVLSRTGNGFTEQRIEHVPDYQTRLAAALRLISLVDRPARMVDEG
jgi:hypothetical protein